MNLTPEQLQRLYQTLGGAAVGGVGANLVGGDDNRLLRTLLGVVGGGAAGYGTHRLGYDQDWAADGLGNLKNSLGGLADGIAERISPSEPRLG